MSLDVRLINMPFARLGSPSLGLAQLKSIAEERLVEAVKVTVEYVNHDFGAAFGVEEYQHISLDEAHLQSGYGDWLFRSIAFPGAADNSQAYLRRYGRILGSRYTAPLAPGGKYSPANIERVLQETIEARRLDEADVIGFSSTFAQTVPSLALARMLRARNPDQLILIGGANCEGVMGQTLAKMVDNIDLVFSGPALISFPEVLEKYILGDLASIPNIDGVIACQRSRKFSAPSRPCGIYGRELNVDRLIPIDYDDFMSSVETFADEPLEISLTFETSRGCWWGQRAHCTFCGLNGATMAYRAMGSDNARTLIGDLVARYYPKVKLFDCVDNIMAREYVPELFSDLRMASDVSLFYETKGDLRDDEVKVLAAAGVNRIQPGIESLLTSTLKLMRKGTTAFQNIRLLKSCLAYGVTPAWNILVGFPGETEDTFDVYRRVLPDLVHLFPPMGVFPVRYDRFSPYHSNPGEYDLNLKPADYYQYCYPYSADVIENIAYYFQNTNVEASYYIPMFDGLAPVVGLVGEWQAHWLKADDSRPRLDLLRGDSGDVVLDTRRGAPIRTGISARMAELLRELSEPRDLSWVEGHYPGLLPELRNAKLVFEERGRVLSLVMLPEGLSAAELENGNLRVETAQLATAQVVSA